MVEVALLLALACWSYGLLHCFAQQHPRAVTCMHSTYLMCTCFIERVAAAVLPCWKLCQQAVCSISCLLLVQCWLFLAVAHDSMHTIRNLEQLVCWVRVLECAIGMGDLT